jgi:glycerophosphoryl diester phosphodiesterase
MKLFLVLGLCCVIFTACPKKVTMKTITNETKKIDLQGHRGCRGLMPENTFGAMLKALQLGVTTLEMDVVITADNQVILSHEPFFSHEITTKQNGEYVSETEERNLNIYKLQYDSILLYDVGLKPHPRFAEQKKERAVKPLLSTIFELVKKHCEANKIALPMFNIETKCLPISDDIYHPKPEKFVALLMKIIKDNKMEKNVIIQSFDNRTLQEVHKNYTNILTALLIEDNDKRNFAQQLSDLGFNPTFYSPHYNLVNQALIKQCNIKNIFVIPWTVNDVPTMQRLKNLGVFGLISDYPNLYKQIQ